MGAYVSHGNIKIHFGFSFDSIDAFAFDSFGYPSQAKGETGGCNACCHGYSHSVVWNLYLYQLHEDDEIVLFYQSDAWGGSAVANHKNRGDTYDMGKEKE